MGPIVSVTISDSRELEIATAIESVVDHVDRVLLVDTGIKDSTVDRARDVAGEKLVVVGHEWVDFSAARNAGLDAARHLGAEWIVIVDSDERLELGGLDLRSTLADIRADVIFVEASNGHYPKEKIIRATSDTRYVGPTHEFLSGGGQRITLAGTSFDECQAFVQLERKFKRDVELLTAYLVDHPDDPRWWYYLGASFEGMGEREHAAEAFGRCVDLRRVGDEAAWAAYKQAEQLFLMERFEESVIAAARGLGANPTFAECAWVAAVSAWKLERAEQAVAWARMAEAVGWYKGCGPARAWFRHMPALYELPYDVLRYALPNESDRHQAETDFHAAKLARIGAANNRDLERLSVSRRATAHTRWEARRTLHPLPLGSFCKSARSIRIKFQPPGGRRPMNPSICFHEGDLWCVIRAVNYEIRGRSYSIDDADGIVRSENYLGRLLLPSGELAGARLVRDLDVSPRQPSRIIGYEDIRLVSLGNALGGSATVCDRDPKGRRLIARLDLNRDGDVTRSEIQPSEQEHEKNWMPLPAGGEIRWIYSLDPTAVLPGPLRECPFALEHLRGGAAIPFGGGGYLCVTHEVIDTDEGRIYMHRFVRLDAEFVVIAVSPAWLFGHYGIEFCAGLAFDGKNLLLSYGVKDEEAWVTIVSADEVKEKMRWITP